MKKLEVIDLLDMVTGRVDDSEFLEGNESARLSVRPGGVQGVHASRAAFAA